MTSRKKLTGYVIVVLCATLVTGTVEGEENCKRMSLTVSGILSINAPVVTSGAPENFSPNQAVAIRVPLEMVGAEDSEAVLRLRRVAMDAWEIDVMSDLKSASPEDKRFVVTGLSVSFDHRGAQESLPEIELYPVSNSRLASQSTARIRFAGIVMADSESRLEVTELSRNTAECKQFSRVDVNNDVNGGVASEMRYHSPDRAYEAFDGDRSSQ